MGRYWAVWTGLAVFLLACLYSIGKPLTSDEADIGAAARAIVSTGTPIYFLGHIPDEYLTFMTRWTYTSTPLPGHQYGLWHTPAYLYSLAASYAVFGVHDWAARLPSVLCILLTLAVLRSLTRLQAGDSAQAHDVFGYVALLFLCNPLITQIGLLASFDNTWMSVANLAFLHEYLRLRARNDVRAVLWQATLVTLCLWAKEYGVVFLCAALGAYELLNRDLRGLLRAVLLVALGTALFTISWVVYCRVLGVPLDAFITSSYVRGAAAPTGSIFEHYRLGGWHRVLQTFQVTWACTLSWASCFFGALGLGVAVWRVREFVRRRFCAPLDLVLLYSFAVFGAAKLVRPSVFTMRYEYAALPALVLGIGFLLHRELGPLRPRALLAVAAIAVGHVFAFGDTVRGTLASGISLSFFWTYAAVSAAALLLGALALRTRRGAVATATALLLGANLGLTWTQTSPYLTTADWLSDYGAEGLREVAVYLSRSGIQDTYPILAKDVGFHVSVELDDTKFQWLSPIALEEAVKKGPAHVDRLLEPRVRHMAVKARFLDPAIAQQLERHGFGVAAQVGDYLVLARPGASPR